MTGLAALAQKPDLMRTITVSVPAELAEAIGKSVQAGVHASEAEAVCAALRMLLEEQAGARTDREVWGGKLPAFTFGRMFGY